MALTNVAIDYVNYWDQAAPVLYKNSLYSMLGAIGLGLLTYGLTGHAAPVLIMCGWIGVGVLIGLAIIYTSIALYHTNNDNYKEGEHAKAEMQRKIMAATGLTHDELNTYLDYSNSYHGFYKPGPLTSTLVKVADTSNKVVEAPFKLVGEVGSAVGDAAENAAELVKDVGKSVTNLSHFFSSHTFTFIAISLAIIIGIKLTD